VINLRDLPRPLQTPRPEPRTASSPALSVEEEGPARAFPDESDTEATTAFAPGEKPVPEGAGHEGDAGYDEAGPPVTDFDDATQAYRFDQEEL
jgi:hypothetical protein